MLKHTKNGMKQSITSETPIECIIYSLEACDQFDHLHFQLISASWWNHRFSPPLLEHLRLLLYITCRVIMNSKGKEFRKHNGWDPQLPSILFLFLGWNMFAILTYWSDHAIRTWDRKYQLWNLIFDKHNGNEVCYPINKLPQKTNLYF